MDIKEALEVIRDGHAIIMPEYAREVCKALGVELPGGMITRWRSDKPGTLKGLTMANGQENAEGVYTLDLSYYVAKALGCTYLPYRFTGRGRQARANAEAVAEKLSQPVSS